MVAYIKRYLQGGGYQSSVSPLIDRDWVIPLQLIRNLAVRKISYEEIVPQWKLNAAEIATRRQDMLFRDSGETFGLVCLLYNSPMALNWLRKWSTKIQKLQNYHLSNFSCWRNIGGAESTRNQPHFMIGPITYKPLPHESWWKNGIHFNSGSLNHFGMSGRSVKLNSHIAAPSERTRRYPSR